MCISTGEAVPNTGCIICAYGRYEMWFGREVSAFIEQVAIEARMCHFAVFT